MNTVIKFDFKTKTKVTKEEFMEELSDIPEFNQHPTMDTAAKHDRAFELCTVHRLIGMYLGHKYLDPMNRVRTVLATLYQLIIANQMDCVGVSNELVDKINLDSKNKK